MLSKAIDDYYTLYEYYGNNEPIINGIAYIMGRNNKIPYRSQIRKQLIGLNLHILRHYLDELVSMPNCDLAKFEVDEFAQLNYIIVRLNTCHESCITMNHKKLNEIIELCNKLKKH